jgi:uncharacterized membrane protein
MKISVNLTKQKGRILFFVILVFSALFYLFNINFSDLWIDETFTKALVGHSFRDMMGLIKNDFHPPLYFYGLKVFVSIFGLSAFTVRLFSVLGVLSSIVLGYTVGQRVFGKSGALYFCLLLLSLPMLASYSQNARMYTWGAFAVTGVFFYAALFISTNKKSDLMFLMLFTLIAAYTHYYGLIAASAANIFVVIFLFIRKNNSWRIHLGYSFVAILCYLPWVLVLIHHTKKAQEFFWVPAVTWQTISSCFTEPFAQKFWMSIYSWPMIIIVYGLTLWVIYRNYIVRKDQHGVVLGVSLFIVVFTILSTAVISLFSQPILYPRYIMNIVILLLVPPTLFFIAVKNIWVKGVIITVLLGCGIYVSIGASYFSYGPYKQSVEYIHKTYPEIKKVFHIIEITAGPFVEYGNSDIENYWFQPKNTIVFTNMDVFSNLHTTDSLGKVLKKDELFCVANPLNLSIHLNENNLKKILSESQLLKVDTVADNKVKYDKIIFLLYILKYQGEQSNTVSDLSTNHK